MDMKKKILALFLSAVCLLAALPAMGVSAAQSKKVFRDVPKNEWFSGYIYGLVDEAVINGMTPTTFEPYTTITREQYMKMLVASVTTPSEVGQYKNRGYFTDLGGSYWASGYVNYAAEQEIIPKGGNFRPREAVTRGDAAVWMYRLSQKFPERAPMTPVGSPLNFTDMKNASGELKEAVDACSQARIITGDKAGTFRPSGNTKRSEAAKMISLLLGVSPRPKDQIPEPPVFVAPTTFSRSVAGVSVSGVEFNPMNGYSSKLALANGKLDQAQPASALKGNAYIAVNGSVFESNTNNRIYSTMISGGELLRIDNTKAPYKPTFVVDKNGKASIQFMRVLQTVTVEQDGQSFSLENVGCNFHLPASGDSTRMIYTSKFGSKVSGRAFRAVAVDGSGKITNIYKNANDVPIPASGYLLFQREPRGGYLDVFFDHCQVGGKLVRSIVYQGSSTQDIATAVACGPTVVKNGAPYGNSATYQQEGNWDSHVLGSGARMAIGVKKDGTVVIASCVGSLGTLSQVMAGLGCETAMNLDGGASTYLNVNGTQIASPGRNLSNMLVFTRA